MPKQRIKVLLHTVSLGGVLRHIQDIVMQLDHTKIELVGVFPDKLLNRTYLPRELDKYHSIFTDAGLRSHTIETPVGLSPMASATAIHAMARLLRQEQPDVVHYHSSMAGAVGRLATLAWRPHRIIYTPHLMYCLRTTGIRRTVFSTIERILYPLTDTVIAVSDSEYHDIAELFGHTNKLTLIRNAVPVDAAGGMLQGAGAELPKDLAHVSGKNIVLSTARFDAQKDVPTLIHAAAILAQERSDFAVLLAGDGEDRSAMAACIQEKNLDGIVHILGWRSDVPQLVAACDVMVLSTHREGLPYAMLEAMAMRKPVIGSDVPGVRECIEHGQSGFLFPCGDAQALANALVLLFDDPALGHAMGIRAQEIVAQRFSPQRMISALEAVYAGVPIASDVQSHTSVNPAGLR